MSENYDYVKKEARKIGLFFLAVIALIGFLMLKN